jgi:putative FmdB family regulatory protein
VPLYDFECSSCGNSFEDFAKTEERSKSCACGQLAERVISAPHLDYRMGIDGSMPTMLDKWKRMHKQQTRIANRLKRDHGDIR